MRVHEPLLMPTMVRAVWPMSVPVPLFQSRYDVSQANWVGPYNDE